MGQGPCSAFHRYEIGELSFAEQRRARFADVAAVAGVPDGDESYTVWESAYEAGLGANVRPYDDVVAFLDALGSIPVAVVTNVRTEFQRTKLASAGLAERLPVVVGVDLAGAPKPDPAPFLLACALLGVEPTDAVHIGDSLVADVEGALAAGVAAIWTESAMAGVADQCRSGHVESRPLAMRPHSSSSAAVVAMTADCRLCRA